LITCSCTTDNTQVPNEITALEIHLHPSFNNWSVILIDKQSNTVRFKVDTTLKYFGAISADYKAKLNNFEKNTLIDSFYSSTFLDSIADKPTDVIINDGINIYTVTTRQNKSDTIVSGNSFPKVLSTNIISQLNYFSKHTNDTLLIKYLDDIKTYLH
jgi:hypothetical protein